VYRLAVIADTFPHVDDDDDDTTTTTTTTRTTATKTMRPLASPVSALRLTVAR
jgi:hypothetical protein